MGLKIEILYTEGCPSHPNARSLLKEVLRDEGVEAEIEEIEIKDQSMAERFEFIGSPTIRINGRDVEREVEKRKDYGLKCRVYFTEAGLKGYPPREMIRQALREAMK